ncbi:alpha/beta hydrolase family protein [Propionicimonas paludicola]|uniref:Alpha/beta hydrolase family protein n=1 Tax=Propionicimonas paludicola TaxID=185243 RepID=A0A2A9CVI8_9ACTN|nr:alpha/beta fold hydrolase [Propionicimonas paludicola]PFG17672.1 alpha/beta hydrolase family protein [Propionicimonas paludicola]
MARPRTASGRGAQTTRGAQARPVRRWPRRLLLVLVAALSFALGLGWPILVRPPLIPGQDAISNAASAKAKVSLKTDDGRYLLVEPPAGVAESDVLVVIYPGGLVRPQAYEWLARREAAAGRTTIIPEFWFDLPVLQPDRAKSMLASYGRGKKVVLIGHSLGGSMAARFVADQDKWGSHPVAGLVLLASYPPDDNDLSDIPGLKAMVVDAENDKVVDKAKLDDGLKRLPAGTKKVRLDGAVHAFFGRYGPQADDGVSTVARTTAEEQLVGLIDAFVATL